MRTFELTVSSIEARALARADQSGCAAGARPALLAVDALIAVGVGPDAREATA